MDPSIQLQITNEFKNINELSEALNILKIIINYAAATSVEPDQPISYFIKRIYFDNIKNSETVLKSTVS
jgi:hypothetical protein